MLGDHASTLGNTVNRNLRNVNFYASSGFALGNTVNCNLRNVNFYASSGFGKRGINTTPAIMNLPSVFYSHHHQNSTRRTHRRNQSHSSQTKTSKK